jgi:sulfate adenylyltransferase subunit 1
VEGLRGYAGRIESGRVAAGDEVLVLPSGQKSRVREVRTFSGPVEQAQSPQPVTVILEDQIDISRGDVLVAPDAPARSEREFEATVCWLSEEPFNRSRRYLIARDPYREGHFQPPKYRVDVNTLAREPADTLALNDIGRIAVKAAQPLAFEPYRYNRAAGSFIVIDEASNNTVAAGMIEEPA